MATGFLSRLRTLTQHFRIGAEAESRAGLQNRSSDAPALLSRLASPNAGLAHADTSWRPDTRPLRIEIMASGPFESLRGIRTAVNHLQDNLVGVIRKGSLELRLTEVRRACRHVTAWSRTPVDPGASTTEWECLVEALADEGQRRALFAPAFRDSVRNRVNHIVLFGDHFDDGFVFLSAATRTFRQHGIRVSTFYLGSDFNGRNMYRFLAAGTGGLYMPLSAQRSPESVLPIVAAFACGDHARLAALPSATPAAKALIAQVRKGRGRSS
jgi:hypothetical protein